MAVAVEDVFWCVAIIIATSVIIRLCDVLWLSPKRIRSKLLSQGIKGPKPSLFYGNVPEINKIQSSACSTGSGRGAGDGSQTQVASWHTHWIPSIFPYLQQWSQQYGGVYMYSTGNKQHLYVSQPDLLKDLNLHKSLNLGKPRYLATAQEPMLGNGIIKANGHEWANQRKLVAPQFFQDKIKGMVGLMVESTMSLVERWESRIKESKEGEVDMIVDYDLRSVSADIISKACFGSSYSQGKDIFAKLGALQATLSKPTLLFGLTNFIRFLPTKSNREVWKLKKEIEKSILELVKDRREESRRQKELGKSDHIERKDLLQMILEDAAADTAKHKTERYIVDNCKNIYFAGYETAAITVAWTLMLLALYPEWQERVRAEIFNVCGHKDNQLDHCLLDMDTFPKLKTMTMVIQETLRLYGPAVIMAREVFEEMKIGDIVVPKGTYIWSLTPELHRDPENWGADANEFKPERFGNGVSGACKHPQAYMPFGFGTRLCVGQNFAIMELKIMLFLILSKFSFARSPNYVHSPIYRMLLIPQHGVRLVVKSL